MMKLYLKKTIISVIALLAVAGSISLIDSTTAFATEATNTTEVNTTEAVPSEAVSLYYCTIIDSNQINIKGVLGGIKTGDDNNLYLFELQPYQDSINGRTDYIKKISKDDNIDFNIALNEGTSETRLYSKFIMTVYNGTTYVPVSNSIYITNPEAIAKSQLEYKAPLTKKGLLIEQSMLADAFDLGVKHVIVNINFTQFIGSGISYEYEGKTYNFSKDVVDGYDTTISTMSNKSMLITAVILNGWNDETPELIYPGVTQKSSAYYYGFNTSTKEGYETTRALASFLSERYSGDDYTHGRISNWIIGNEINNNEIWNYMGSMELNKYVAEYARSFRVFYTAIKSESANARLFFSTDYDWIFKDASNLKYSSKDILDTFNADITNSGNIDWNLAYHPYSIPMTEPEFWDDAATGLVTQDISSPVINFANLSVLTDYLQNDNLKTSSGNVRHVILSEEGFTSESLTRGTNTDLQAAAFAYAYYIADSNPYIDAFILSRQVDAPTEADLSLSFGLWSCDMNSRTTIKATQRKKIWSVFKDIDKKTESIEATEFAKSIIGISKWSDVIPDFRYKSQE